MAWPELRKLGGSAAGTEWGCPWPRAAALDFTLGPRVNLSPVSPGSSERMGVSLSHWASLGSLYREVWQTTKCSAGTVIALLATVVTAINHRSSTA